MTQNINDILAEREKTHGNFEKQAYTSREFKKVIQETYASIPRVQHEALDMIAVKISRILHGDSNSPQHWEDIVGYATLVEKTLRKPVKDDFRNWSTSEVTDKIIANFKTDNESRKPKQKVSKKPTKTRKTKRRKTK